MEDKKLLTDCFDDLVDVAHDIFNAPLPDDWLPSYLKNPNINQENRVIARANGIDVTCVHRHMISVNVCGRHLTINNVKIKLPDNNILKPELQLNLNPYVESLNIQFGYDRVKAKARRLCASINWSYYPIENKQVLPGVLFCHDYKGCVNMTNAYGYIIENLRTTRRIENYIIKYVEDTPSSVKLPLAPGFIRDLIMTMLHEATTSKIDIWPNSVFTRSSCDDYVAQFIKDYIYYETSGEANSIHREVMQAIEHAGYDVSHAQELINARKFAREIADKTK